MRFWKKKPCHVPITLTSVQFKNIFTPIDFQIYIFLLLEITMWIHKHLPQITKFWLRDVDGKMSSNRLNFKLNIKFRQYDDLTDPLHHHSYCDLNSAIKIHQSKFINQNSTVKLYLHFYLQGSFYYSLRLKEWVGISLLTPRTLREWLLWSESLKYSQIVGSILM